MGMFDPKKRKVITAIIAVARENSAIISDSHTRIMPIFRLPIPRILYSPNSFFLRFIRNEFV